MQRLPRFCRRCSRLHGGMNVELQCNELSPRYRTTLLLYMCYLFVAEKQGNLVKSSKPLEKKNSDRARQSLLYQPVFVMLRVGMVYRVKQTPLHNTQYTIQQHLHTLIRYALLPHVSPGQPSPGQPSPNCATPPSESMAARPAQPSAHPSHRQDDNSTLSTGGEGRHLCAIVCCHICACSTALFSAAGCILLPGEWPLPAGRDTKRPLRCIGVGGPRPEGPRDNSSHCRAPHAPSPGLCVRFFPMRCGVWVPQISRVQCMGAVCSDTVSG